MDGWMDGSWMYAHTLARMDTHGQTYTCSYLSSNDHHILSLNQKLKTEDSRLGTISSTLKFFKKIALLSYPFKTIVEHNTYNKKRK